ncbi:MAG: ribosome assembly RNA-binding protein YhbY [Candidatus Wallbacteria bacterium HGW-Wallbacteria-1]|uniref:Ribosome assembly RNA-binding protein YhbY n=1 Tax=Candidatus Wallbacteria bacterium HGW-Wallbacteria-1 TaxID=2013854 RepID=A0A2N1PU56_9BACT|nr:MAG: ribosome assembly RNA-binding protein YhbY [Candidatus Wallbacteria bacterium HGW-Wallbacteria-1]
MIKGSQRSFLKSLANPLKSLLQIGKDGVSDDFVSHLEQTLEQKELVKVSILKNCKLDATEVANELAQRTGAEFVQAIGSKFVLYRRSIENPQIKLP